MRYADYMYMSPEDRMRFYINLDSKGDREKILFFRAQAELMLAELWRREDTKIAASLRAYDSYYGITAIDLR